MSNRNLAAAAPQILGILLSTTSIAGHEHRGISSQRNRRRERKELYEFLASDHRPAADIGYRHQRP